MKARCSARRAGAPARARPRGVLPAFAALATPLLALAQPSTPGDPAPPSPDQQVVVTAARAAQPLPDTLPATTVITREDLDASPASDLPGALRLFTSLDVSQQGPLGAQTSVFVRGANSNQVLVLLDGAPLARADFGSAPWELIPLDQVERIEIVRGNLSALYGAQAVGGVVQVFTRRGAGTSVSASLGNLGQARLSGSISRRVGDTDGPLDLHASASAQVTDGFSARDPRTDPAANPDRDPAWQQAATAGLGKTWSPGQRTEFNVMHSTTHSDYDGTTTTVQQDVLQTQLDEFTLDSRHALTGTLGAHFSAGETLVHFTDPTEAFGLFGPMSTDGSGRTRLLGVELDWQAHPDHELQAQFEDRDERFGDTLDEQRHRRTTSERLGWLGHFGDAVEVQANARHDDADDYGTANTGLVAIGWHVTKAWQLVAQWSSAFSAPSFSDLFYAAGPLKAERSRDVELGVHWQGADWLARATWFSQRQHDLIGFDADFQTINIGHASNQGVELAADGKLGPGRLGLDATFQRPRDDDTGTRLLRRARTNASVHYRVPLGAWETGAWLRYTGMRADVDPVTFATVNAPSRTLVGLSAQRRLSPDWTFGVTIDNAANSRVPETLGYTAPPREILFTLRGQWQ